jgi:predicted aldo/keto reductase-like oxidoreductase
LAKGGQEGFKKGGNQMARKIMNRRNFMKSTLVSVAGFPLLASGVLKQEEKVEEKGGEKRKFIYRTLGKTGIKLPVISMGMVYAGNPNLVRAALDAGILYLDTAHVYQRGQSEEVIGGVIKGRPRDSYVIGTKVVFPTDKVTFLYAEEPTEEAFIKRLDESLKRLGLDYVDILYHQLVARKESALFEPILKAMEKAKNSGKARFVGISTHRNEPEVIQAAIDSKFYEIVLTAYNFKQKHYLQVKEAIAKAAQSGLGVVAMKVMGGVTSQDPLRPINPSAALKWVLQDVNVTTAVPGFCTFEEMKTDLSVMEDLPLTDSEKEYLKTACAAPGLYCQGCGQCEKQCVAKLPIPDLMRAYMYTYGYRRPAVAQELVVSLGLPPRVCEECGVCPVKCSIGFDVPGKIRDVARLRDVPTEFIA